MSEENRRPIKARSVSLFRDFAAYLARTNITPNQISVASVAFSLMVPLALIVFPIGSWAATIFAVLGIQLRLFCNLLDGMVAIEGAKKSVMGDIYNEFPDRLADTIIILGFAYPVMQNQTVHALAWCTAFFAIFTAYTRVLGAAVGAKHYFSGPMAKQHRMALITLAILLIPMMKEFLPLLIAAVLLAICVGCIATIARRLMLISSELKTR